MVIYIYTSLKLWKSQLRRRMSSGGKSRVPLGGLTSIFCARSWAGIEEREPDRPDRALELELAVEEEEEEEQQVLRRVNVRLGRVAEEREKQRRERVRRRFGWRIRREGFAGMVVEEGRTGGIAMVNPSSQVPSAPKLGIVWFK